MRIVFIGSGEIGVPALRALLANKDCAVVGVIAQPDRPAGRQLKLTPPPVKLAATDAGLTVYQPEKINDDEAAAWLAALKPDLAIVCAYGQILRQRLLDIPRLGCWNIHASLLPKYRGSSCIQAAIRAGDPVTGITIMRMNAGLDTGDIILRRELPILPDDTAGTLHDRLAQLAPEALTAALRLDKIPRTPQDHALATYAGKLKKEDGRIDWHRDAAEIERHIRAMTPWPSAFTQYAGKTLKISSATVIPCPAAAPGTILRSDETGVTLATGKDAILLREVQPESRRRMTAAEWARGGLPTAFDQ